ncbi:MAG TPA: serine/threonine-protein kinase, partial [Ktedonobacteraceae bacterium]|nr:serine/threonine-protein kinase [Ktedonobacteraceae bacterium]
MADLVGHQLGNYRLIRLLGHGGFADVYLGEHIYLNTLAAIKILDARLTAGEITQFRDEARTIARLEHPHIVRVLDFGVDDHLPFLVMSYAPNGTLRQRHPKGARLSAGEVLPYVKQVSDALQYAHYEKLIHRDVKPENMLLDRNNQIMLSDFGLAIASYSSSQESPRDVSGTIAYMAPEQTRGKPRPASDQYALGVVVYEWLCGTRPFNGSYQEIAVQQVLNPPQALHEHEPTISPVLEAVVLKALAKDPLQRFACIHDFAGAFEQACQGIQPTIESSQHALSADSLSSKPSTITPHQENFFSTDRSPTTMVYAVAWSPDRRHIASGGHDGMVHVWDATTGFTSFIYYGHAGGVTAIAWSPDGLYIASASLDKTVQVWNVGTGQKISSYHGHAGMIYAVAWSPDGKRIASTNGGGTDTSVHIWDSSTGEKVLTYRGHAYWTRAIAWSPDGKFVASGSLREVQVWNATNGSKASSYRGHEGWVRAIAWSPDGKRIASSSEDKAVQIWEVSKGKQITTYRGHTDWVGFVMWS